MTHHKLLVFYCEEECIGCQADDRELGGLHELAHLHGRRDPAPAHVALPDLRHGLPGQSRSAGPARVFNVYGVAEGWFQSLYCHLRRIFTLHIVIHG